MRQIASIPGPAQVAAPAPRTIPPLPLVRGSELPAWIAIFLISAVTAVLMTFNGLRFDGRSALGPGFAVLGFLGGALLYRTWRPDERIAVTLMAVAQVITFSAAAAMFSYAAASHGGALWDARFMAWDQALGLDWRAYLNFVDARPWLALIYSLAYQSLMVQFIAAIGILGLTGRFIECRTLILAVAIAGLIVIAVSGLMPALGVPAHLHLQPGDYPHADFAAGCVHLAPLNAIRAGTLHILSLTHAEGIVTFPSFHASLGVIFLWGFWSVRWARWPGLALNALLIAATPIGGGHYFVDVIAGSAIALLAIVLAARLDWLVRPSA